jgi:hypothetical protein
MIMIMAMDGTATTVKRFMQTGLLRTRFIAFDKREREILVGIANTIRF